MLSEEFINDINKKYGFTIESITAMMKDENGNIIKNDNIYKKGNNNSFNAGKQYVAINLLKNNMDINFVSRVTHFSLEYLKKLKRRIN